MHCSLVVWGPIVCAMTYDLFIGDKAFSSWSLRGWLMLERFGLPYRAHLLGLYSGQLPRDLLPLAPARSVPVLKCADGALLTDSLAIAEELATRHPDLGYWPAAPLARARARSMVAEMHAGFGALRQACPMQLFHQWVGYEPSEAVQADLERVETLVALARAHTVDGPWLFGAYSLADVFYAPLMARLAGYGLPASPELARYRDLTLADPAFCAWRADGIARRYDPFPYPQPLPTAPWPDPMA